jgi:hypothetical protein
MAIENAPSMQDSAAIGECLRAISANPSIAELRKALGDRLFLTGRFHAALANYRKARELNPNVAGLMQWLDRAEAAYRAGLEQTEGAKKIVIPYRENRAIIFNSDLFHETAPMRFRTEYESRRINVNLLHGDRANASPVRAS